MEYYPGNRAYGLPDGARYPSGAELVRLIPGWEKLQDSSPKLFRAFELYHEIRQQLRHFLPDNRVRFLVEQDTDDPGRDVLVLHDSTDKKLIREWALMLGDAVHNARSALDHAVYSLVESNHHTPDDKTGFPTARRRRDLRRDAVKGAAPGVLDAVLKLQPWERGKGHGHWLWVLSYLDNVDKHRLLLDLDNWWSQEFRTFDAETGKTTTEWISITGHHDGEVVRTGPRGSIRPGQANGTIYIASRDGDKWDGNGPEGYRLPAEIVLQKCLEACVAAIGRMGDAT